MKNMVYLMSLVYESAGPRYKHQLRSYPYLFRDELYLLLLQHGVHNNNQLLTLNLPFMLKSLNEGGIIYIFTSKFLTATTTKYI